MNKLYHVDFKKLVLLLIPTFLRRPLIAALCLSATNPFRHIHTQHVALIADNTYRLNHNGQVCYLRATINDLFDAQERRIAVEDIPENFQEFVIYERRYERSVLSQRKNGGVMVYKRGYFGHDRYDFCVRIPVDMEIDKTKLRSLINKYKLASKRYVINHI